MPDSHFDAIVVGSGFGGSATACRLAEAGLRVRLLERGKAYPPGSFPRSPWDIKKNFWDPKQNLYGLYNFWSFKKIEALVSSGLGGGSLIYANVLIRKPEKWFVKEEPGSGYYEHWPVDRAMLDPYYDRAERVLGATPYPIDHPPYSDTLKTKAMKDAAEKLGLEWSRPNLAVTFGNPGEAPSPGETIREAYPNYHGKNRVTCQLCGECDVGCNYGSKNTLDFNYITLAERSGAEIRTLCEVRRIEPLDGGGYAAHYRQHDGAGTSTHERVTAKYLILAAGTIGSTYLMLRNRANFPQVSKTLGQRFCGNGDLLSFALKAQVKLRAPLSPVITSTVCVADTADGGSGRGYYVQDAGYPEFVGLMLETMNTAVIFRRIKNLLRLGFRWIARRIDDSYDSDWSAELSSLIPSSKLSENSMPLLGMGRDIADANFSLKGTKLHLDWSTKTSKQYFARVDATMRALTGHWGAQHFDNPLGRLNRVLTVHPLGGCAMGRDDKEGVVDSYGEVFNYPGLHILDGSIMPGPTGPNPSLTIAALAERAAEHIAEQHNQW